MRGQLLFSIYCNLCSLCQLGLQVSILCWPTPLACLETPILWSRSQRQYQQLVQRPMMLSPDEQAGQQVPKVIQPGKSAIVRSLSQTVGSLPPVGKQPDKSARCDTGIKGLCVPVYDLTCSALACICINKLLCEAPPSTLSSLTSLKSASFCMASRTSLACTGRCGHSVTSNTCLPEHNISSRTAFACTGKYMLLKPQHSLLVY